MSHPVNCEFLTIEDNNRKKANCSISLDELKTEIKIWNKSLKI